MAWILTNSQVVVGARTVTVRFPGNNSIHTGSVLGEDDGRDLAVLTVCCNLNWKALPTASSYAVRAGSEIVTLGFPGYRWGMEISVTTGLISSIGFNDASRSWLIQTQTDVSLYPGNSGGPLLNAQGQVIGIVSARVDPLGGDNISFAISMRTVELELDNLEVAPTATGYSYATSHVDSNARSDQNLDDFSNPYPPNRSMGFMGVVARSCHSLPVHWDIGVVDA